MDDERSDGDGFRKGRKVATMIILPFVVLGIGNLILILQWGLTPLWGFLLMPPILFICVIGWIAIRGGFAEDRTGEGDYDGGV
jgi:cobalamin synthase